MGQPLKYLRLGILGVIAALIIGISNFCFNILFSDDEIAAGPVVKRVAEGQIPLYSMTITPAKARVIFSRQDKGESSFVVSDGNLHVTMPRGEYDVRATSKDYRPRTYTIDLSRQPMEITLDLEPFWSLLEVITDPDAQVVAIRESGERIDLGEMPANGIIRAERTLYKGIYSLEVSRPKYKTTLLKDIDLPFSKLITRKVVLDPAPGKLLVLTQPEGADVLLDGTNMGKTPLNLDELDVETPLSLEIALADYRPKKLTMNLPPGFDDSLDLGQLQRKAGIIDVQLSLLGGATPGKLAQVEYRVAGKTFKEPSGRLQEVYEGNQNLEIEHPDYYLWDQKVRVVDGRTTIVKAELAPRPARLTIQLDSQHPFSVVADGQTVPHREDIFEIPAERELVVEVQIRDHLSVSRKMRFAANEEQSWKVEAKPIPGPDLTQEWTIPYIGTIMAWIKPGEFRLGSPAQEQSRLPNEGPATTVNFPHGFWMAKYEVTQSDYQRIMEKNPSEFKGLKHPVDHVTWQQAAEYCRKINQTEKEAGRLPDNYNYRLPTEAEWEYACRAGTSAPYSFGRQADQKLGNFKGGYPREYGETLHISADKYGTVPVGSYAANPWGLYDMHGNTGEWCWDNFNSRYPGGMVENWSGPAEGADKVYRGGGWGSFAHQCRSAARQRLRPSTASNLVGFRLVLAPTLTHLRQFKKLKGLSMRIRD